MIEELISKISESLINKPIGKIDALQERLSPIPSKMRREQAKKNVPRESAVLFLIHPIDSVAHFTLIKRATYSGVHSGQISLPGGKRDAQDNSLVETALRECQEEIGVKIPTGNVIGELQSIYVPPSNFIIHPYVAYSKEQLTFSKEDREVDEIIHVTAKQISSLNIKVKNMELTPGYLSDVSYYELNKNVVWGATATILAEIDVLIN